VRCFSWVPIIGADKIVRCRGRVCKAAVLPLPLQRCIPTGTSKSLTRKWELLSITNNSTQQFTFPSHHNTRMELATVYVKGIGFTESSFFSCEQKTVRYSTIYLTILLLMSCALHEICSPRLQKPVQFIHKLHTFVCYVYLTGMLLANLKLQNRRTENAEILF